VVPAGRISSHFYTSHCPCPKRMPSPSSCVFFQCDGTGRKHTGYAPPWNESDMELVPSLPGSASGAHVPHRPLSHFLIDDRASWTTITRGLYHFWISFTTTTSRSSDSGAPLEYFRVALFPKAGGYSNPNPTEMARPSVLCLLQSRRHGPPPSFP